MDAGLLIRAILADDVAALQRALDSGVPMDRVEAFGLPPLFLAVSCCRLKTASLLVDNGANVNGTTSGGITPLMLAVVNVERGRCAPQESVKLVRMLIEHGADPNRRSHHGKTALMLAANDDQRAIVDILIQCGANLDAKDHFGNSAEDYARRASSHHVIARFERARRSTPC